LQYTKTKIIVHPLRRVYYSQIQQNIVPPISYEHGASFTKSSYDTNFRTVCLTTFKERTIIQYTCMASVTRKGTLGHYT